MSRVSRVPELVCGKARTWPQVITEELLCCSATPFSRRPWPSSFPPGQPFRSLSHPRSASPLPELTTSSTKAFSRARGGACAPLYQCPIQSPLQLHSDKAVVSQDSYPAHGVDSKVSMWGETLILSPLRLKIPKCLWGAVNTVSCLRLCWLLRFSWSLVYCHFHHDISK